MASSLSAIAPLSSCRNNAEHQLAFIEMLRFITDGVISPEEAVRAYHGVLQAKGIKARLPLEQDLHLTDASMSYAGNSSRRATVTVDQNPLRDTTSASHAQNGTNRSEGDWPKHQDGSPDFARMTSTQRRTFDHYRLTNKFG